MRTFLSALAIAVLGAALIGVASHSQPWQPSAVSGTRSAGSCPSTSGGVWNLFGHATSGSTSATVTVGPFDSTCADLIVVSVNQDATVAAGAVTDNKGNGTYTGSPANIHSLHSMFYIRPTTVGTGHTITYTVGAASFPSVQVAAFSGSVSSPLDTYGEDSAAGNADVTNATLDPPPTTPVADKELFVVGGGAGAIATCTFSINSGFTITDQFGGSSVDYNGMMSYFVQPTAALLNPQITCTGGFPLGIMSTFKHS